jgi:hypothetical protein
MPTRARLAISARSRFAGNVNSFGGGWDLGKRIRELYFGDHLEEHIEGTTA